MTSPTPVSVSRQPTVFPTFLPEAPNPLPMFLERRVYQGSSGRVYPLPCIDRIAEQPRPRAWDTIVIENDYLRVTILPELGGRIHRAQDKTNGYDFIYYQPVLKPALVGLAGPWASGGIEFNWPQHHRPSTFMPADVAIEQHPDGAATVWLSEHDPMARMKGMYGVRLHPGRSVLELVVRAYNRTDDVQTFLWWSNVATRVHGHYQSFFPPDVTHVADHAKRATATFPRCRGVYYGIDYGQRAKSGIPAAEQPRQFAPPAAGPHPELDYAPNDLSWYANIPVPTSYMAMGSQEDFAGGYDHRAQAGIVQIADHHIAPGKKQWTWGNHEFGYAWDRNLTEPDENGIYAPYIELMSGAFTDNQPDFSYLQPGETKTWSQFWYPIRHIGPAQSANAEAAVSLRAQGTTARIGVAVTSAHPDAVIDLTRGGKTLGEWRQSLAPDRSIVFEVDMPSGECDGLKVAVTTASGHKLISYTVRPSRAAGTPPPAAKEPPLPRAVATADELYLIGLHLEQYRHATRAPEAYWREALRRDPRDARCSLALGRWHLRRGEFGPAEELLRTSIARLTAQNPNPADGEAFYQLGRCLRARALAEPENATALERDAYTAFFKSTWNHAWQPAGFHALAEIDATRRHWETALNHVTGALRLNADNMRARNLQAVVLRELGRESEAAAVVTATRALDPLDWWARHLAGQELHCDAQVRLDLALDYVRIGRDDDALAVLANVRARSKGHAGLSDASLGSEPLVAYYRAWLSHRVGRNAAAQRHLRAAAKADPAYCFPVRTEEIAILRHAIAQNSGDARAPFYLGNLLFDRRRHAEAITCWEAAVKREPGNGVAWRNLGIAYFNVQHRPAAARRAYARAVRARLDDARLRYESDQLEKRLGTAPLRRLRQLQRCLTLVKQRDDLAVELCTLYNQVGRPERAAAILTGRKFQPWEGGEGQALGQHVRTHLALGRRALRGKQAWRAIAHFELALSAPANLGEAKHLLANQSDLHFWLGCAHAAAGDAPAARSAWLIAAETRGDFQAMSVRPFSEMTFYSARALQKLGQGAAAQKLLRGLLGYARKLARTPAGIDYFATSLPTLLLFLDDLDARQKTSALFLEAQARLGLGETAAARNLLRQVLARDPNHPLAADFLSARNE